MRTYEVMARARGLICQWGHRVDPPTGHVGHQSGQSIIELMVASSITVIVAYLSTTAIQNMRSGNIATAYSVVPNNIIAMLYANANLQGLLNSVVATGDPLLSCVIPNQVPNGTLCMPITLGANSPYVASSQPPLRDGTSNQPIAFAASVQPNPVPPPINQWENMVFVSGAFLPTNVAGTVPCIAGCGTGTPPHNGHPMPGPNYYNRNGVPVQSSANADFAFFTTYLADCVTHAANGSCPQGFNFVQLQYSLIALTVASPSWVPTPPPAPLGGNMTGVADRFGSLVINLAVNGVTTNPTSTPTGGQGGGAPPGGSILFKNFVSGGTTYPLQGPNQVPLLIPMPCATQTPSCYPNAPTGGMKNGG